MVKYPGVTDYFLAGVAGGIFIKDVLKQMMDLACMGPH